MPTINLAVPHSLKPEEAVRRIKNLVTDIKAQFADKVTDVKEEWTGANGAFGFKVMGFDISGTVRVDTREVQIQSSLPFAALPFKSRIEMVIQEKAKQLLA
ncbi:polyhydroxyalkanoic acid system family protein [bacterium]|nr:polyhydroxyalkanoic acid system family protein [bacterium]MCI0605369.1 polyhydroxyalkanoic acid system family protein [bacterium]